MAAPPAGACASVAHFQSRSSLSKDCPQGVQPLAKQCHCSVIFWSFACKNSPLAKAAIDSRKADEPLFGACKERG